MGYCLKARYNLVMLLISHITIALLSLLGAGLAVARPGRQILGASYTLVGLTAATGTVLTLQSPAHLMQACATGLAYLAVAFALTLAARQRLARV